MSVLWPGSFGTGGGRDRALVYAVVALIGHIGPALGERDDPYESINDSWDRFGSVYGRVVEHYYSPVEHDVIMRAAIEGMLRQLDAYSQYFDEEGLRQLRQDTTGRFAGLGITVGILDQTPVVIAPIEGTPADRAGLLPGDLIVAIEGRATFGRSLEEVVTELRGEPGSSVRITIRRRGVIANWDVVIVREMIRIRSVAVSEEIHPGIGYISMRQTRFSEETAVEMETALEQLFAAGVKGLILDLRGNPGGLLSQATEVADLFLAKGAPIVSVRERSDRRKETKHSERRPAAAHLPLVILIDGGSASAAEIVAGAVQDNDRGLVVGTTSFGKGSVQTIFDLSDHDRAALKLTTALYFTPSGRSIHRESLTAPRVQQVPFGDARLPVGMLLSLVLTSPDVDVARDRLRARFDLDEEMSGQILETTLGGLAGRVPASVDSEFVENRSYRTNGGRVVYGSGGIEPDLVVESAVLPPYVQELRRHRVFFDFVVDYVGRRTEGEDGPTPTEVDETMLAAFWDYLPGSAAGETRRRRFREALRVLRDLADESALGAGIQARLDTLEAFVEGSAAAVPPSAELEDYLRAELSRELALRVEGRKASLLVALKEDPQVLAAVGLLRDPGEYERVLSGRSN